MSNNKIIINQYIKKIDKLLPYSSNQKEIILNRLETDVKEALVDANNDDPLIVFGSPEKVARDISLSQNWALKRASYKKRTVAFLIDLTIQVFAIVIGLILWFDFVGLTFIDGKAKITTNNEFLALASLIVIIVPYVLFWILGYFILLEKLINRTIGKMILGLMVVDETGIKINWSQALIRNLTKSQVFLLMIEITIGYMEKTNLQRPTDIVAKTIVIVK